MIFKTLDGGLIEINRTGEPNESLWIYKAGNGDRYNVSLLFKIFGFYILKWNK